MRPSRDRTLPYGSWTSPISAERIVAGSIRLVQPSLDGDCAYWIESRPADGGRSVLVRRNASGHHEDLTPAPYNARSRVHEYGGGAYLASRGRCWFVNFVDQCIYETATGGAPVRLTEPGPSRFADLCYDERRKRLLAVCEDHSGAGEPANRLVSIALGDGVVTPLHDGYDFYSAPRLSPDGCQLAWLCWNHPNLPWDNTELWVGRLGEDGRIRNPQRLGSGHGEALLQPEWSDDGHLYFVSDADDWWNLYCWDGTERRQITHARAELGQPMWMFATRNYGLGRSGHALGSFTRAGTSRLFQIRLATGQLEPMSLPYTDIEHVAIQGRRALLLAGAPDRPMAIIELDVDKGAMRILKEAETLDLDAAGFARPEEIDFATSGGASAHALFYAPHNPRHNAPGGSRPPLLVKCHGGPTAAAGNALDLRTQYWTSRGFAVLDVNYRGSTGFGRAYRHSLYGHWGIADVDDCVHGARYTASQGWTDPARMLIRGGSAGGYTVLCALAFHGVFRAGASYFGIGDLAAMFEHTHKFESHYDHWLLGLNGDKEAVFAARSPARHADRIGCPVIFFQGLDDKVVPPQQSEQMVDILRRKGLPVAYLAFPGEGHGFRQAATIRTALESELGFYARILGFQPADALPPLTIDNLD